MHWALFSDKLVNLSIVENGVVVVTVRDTV